MNTADDSQRPAEKESLETTQDFNPSDQLRSTAVQRVRWSPWHLGLLTLAILTTYFAVQSWVYRGEKSKAPAAIAWLSQWDAAAASGESAAARSAWLRDAFENLPQAVAGEPPKYVEPPTELDQLLQTLTAGSQRADGQPLLESIDWPRYERTVRQCHFFRMAPDGNGGDGSRDDELVTWLRDGVLYPWRWNRYRVIAIKRVAGEAGVDGAEYRVMSLLIDDAGHFHEVCWWCVDRGDRWLAYDWEIIDFGLRETTEAALEWTLRGHPALHAYDELMTAPRDRVARFDRELKIPVALRDALFVQLAYDYLELERWEDALKMCGRVTHPNLAIGAQIAEARAHLFLDELQPAREATNSLEATVGPSIHVRELRAALADSADSAHGQQAGHARRHRRCGGRIRHDTARVACPRHSVESPVEFLLQRQEQRAHADRRRHCGAEDHDREKHSLPVDFLHGYLHGETP